ncbi:hypothetical protein [Streptosporangium sp. KLBMP 9127]|nr:hypothetical protein [Streptosporangium sp. KLBMP 9127]
MLRKAGRREFSERHGGFVVEGSGDGKPFQVADDAEVSAQKLARSDPPPAYPRRNRT